MARRKPIVVITLPKVALSKAEFETLKKDFIKAGFTPIIVPVNNNSPMFPKYEFIR